MSAAEHPIPCGVAGCWYCASRPSQHHTRTIEHRAAVPGAEMPFCNDAWRWTCSCGRAGGWRNRKDHVERGHTLHVTKATGRPALISVRP